MTMEITRDTLCFAILENSSFLKWKKKKKEANYWRIQAVLYNVKSYKEERQVFEPTTRCVFGMRLKSEVSEGGDLLGHATQKLLLPFNTCLWLHMVKVCRRPLTWRKNNVNTQKDMEFDENENV